MESRVSLQGHRNDIEGLRAIAVLAVICFHFGYLPNGYLGVDVFFVISGYLISKIIFKEIAEGRFSLKEFYLRRIRRIIPLVLFLNLIALAIGCYVMLPDDLENLSQSVIATNAFSNNILQLITTRNYWDVVNEYKPLMHTWSLGIEEQFYLFYPILFMLLGKKRPVLAFRILILLTVASFLLYIFPGAAPSKFYAIPYRFFELAIGGIGAAIFKNNVIKNKFAFPQLVLLIALMVFKVGIPNYVLLIVTVLLSFSILISANQNDFLASKFLENKLMVGLGMISFSLYMWHQVVLAFTRYFIIEKYTILQACILFLIIVLLSIISFYLIEQPFRNKKKVTTRILLLVTGSAFLFTTIFAFRVYTLSGVLHDIPELELSTKNITKNMHSNYNHRIEKMTGDFTDNKKIKILVIGNSFARDGANVLLESKYGSNIEISYAYSLDACNNAAAKVKKANYLFFSELSKEAFNTIKDKYLIDSSKVWVFGVKSFGISNGFFYNNRNKSYYCKQRTEIDKGLIAYNKSLKLDWGKRYINLMDMVIDEKGTMPVFSPDCKYISQDCRHFTQAGAVYFASMINRDSTFVLN